MATVLSQAAHMTSPHHDLALCPACGSPQSRIDDLENEVRVLTEQSIAAANKLTSYEEEIRSLRQQRSAAQAEAQHAKSASIDTTSSEPRGLTRFASFRYGGGTRKISSGSSPSQPSVDLGDLQSQLARETAARVEAERKAAQANGELEDLSQQLFEQANEMVATERRARSKLEERVAVLEQRDKDKARRLERIESALRRIERVKGLLGT